jgi:MATE family multidrug resistance protein
VWAAPATISHYAIQGWFIGMQNSRTPMVIAISINVLSIIFSFAFVEYAGMGVEGIAYGILVAQYLGIVLSIVLWLRYYRRFVRYVNWRVAMSWRPFLKFFDVNKDIFLRTLMNNVVYTFFPFISRDFGTTMLATNVILIQIFTLFSYIQDSLGYAAEALVGRFTGSRNYRALRESIIRMFYWSGGLAVVFVGIFAIFWRDIIMLFSSSPSIIECAGEYIIWIIVVPLAGFAPFLMDGIFIGATRTRILRDSMAVSVLVFFGLYYGLVGQLGATALWLAFVIFVVSRGVCQLVMSRGLKELIN